MLFDINGEGEREYIASGYTAVIYEQEFGADVVDEFITKFTTGGRRRVSKAHSLFLLRVMWAMARTADELAKKNHEPCEPVPAKFEDWLLFTGPINVQEVNQFATNEFQRGLLRTDDTEEEAEDEQSAKE